MKSKNNRQTILIIDDSQLNITIINNYLKFDYNILSSKDGYSGIELAVESKPDLILLDILMPDIDGYEVCSILKKDTQTRDIPIIFLTALSDAETEVKCFELGAVDYISKPICFQVLKARVNTHLQLRLHQIRLEEIVKNRTNQLLLSNHELKMQIIERKRAEDIVRSLNEDLEKRISERTIELRKINNDLLLEIEHRKNIENELIDAKQLAEKASNAKSVFLSNMTHEIRTPLNGILGMTEIGLELKLDDKVRNLLEIINTEATSLLDIINDILDFSKIEAGKMDIEAIPFDLQYLMDDMIRVISIRAEQKGLRFISFLSPDLPVKLIGDPGRLRQIIVNLAGNSLKFTHEGEIFIKVELVDESGQNINVKFTVKDTGIGIPEEQQNKIFESFQQGEGSTTRKYGGTGLGTTIAKQLVELMNGEIFLTSVPKKGTTFWFIIPFIKQDIKNDKKNIFENNTDLKNMNIMLIDDNKTNQYVLSQYLTSWGANITQALNFNDFIKSVQNPDNSKIKYNAIIIDTQIINTDGLELAKKIKDYNKQIPIIVLCSFSNRGDCNICRKIGIDGFLSKPIKLDELRIAILSVTGKLPDKISNNYDCLITKHTISESFNNAIKILLVEDYPTNQKLAVNYLKSEGFLVDIAENGKIAVEKFEKNQYNLILMDIQMPVMDGYEATKQIRTIEYDLKKIETPIIAMTAHSLKSFKNQCFMAGMNDYIAKPIIKKDFITIVNKWIILSQDNILNKIALDIETNNKINSDKNSLSIDINKAIEEFDGKKEIVIDLFDIETNNKINSDKNSLPIDINKAIEEFDGKKEIVIMVLKEFIANLKKQLLLIKESIENNDYNLLSKEAHSIKGGAANITAYDISNTASKLEKTAQSKNMKNALILFENLQKEVSLLEQYCNYELNSYS